MSNFLLEKRRQIANKPNPLDKTTIVSVFPREITVRNHTLQPGAWTLPAGKEDVPSLTIVGPSSWWRDIDPEQPLLEIPTSSVQIADSIVKDWCNGLIECDMAEKMPGLFYVPGIIDSTKLHSEYKPFLHKAIVSQRKWYESLIAMADTDWARSNGSPNVISELSRMAAQELNVSRDWTVRTSYSEMVRCQACGAMRNPSYPICMSCKAVDPEHPLVKAGKLKFAQ